MPNPPQVVGVPRHAMWREIQEQPKAIAATLALYVDGDRLLPMFVEAVNVWLGSSRDIVIAASGSSRHAALHGKAMIEALAGVATQVQYASEYGLATVDASAEAAVMVISQSGETADSLEALRLAIGRGRRTLSITNVRGSRMALEAMVGLYTVAGPEEAIPATKSFVTQLLLAHLIALAIATARATLPEQAIRTAVQSLSRIPELLRAQLRQDSQLLEISAERCLGASPLVYLGRGLHYALACEGALKLKETAYIPAEALPTGELKHGPIAMLGEKASLVVLATRDLADPTSVRRYEKTLQLLQELQAQAVDVLAIASEGDDRIESLSSRSISTPAADEALSPFMALAPLQLLAYHAAVKKGVDVDRPRNLVKSVRD
jgi:glucosamine--fructose-6-phosphate aminotransferase (isomerizing)